MGNIYWGPPPGLVKLLQEQLSLSTFIETGTYKAETACWASACFHQVITVELSATLVQEARDLTANIANIQVIEGESGYELEQLVPNLKTPALFWLDAHWCGAPPPGVVFPGVVGSQARCPLIRELRAINRSSSRHAIVIDDAHEFLCPSNIGVRYSEWPTLSDVVGVINELPGRYVVVVEDCIVAVPSSCRAALESYCLRWYQAWKQLRDAGAKALQRESCRSQTSLDRALPTNSAE